MTAAIAAPNVLRALTIESSKIHVARRKKTNLGPLYDFPPLECSSSSVLLTKKRTSPLSVNIDTSYSNIDDDDDGKSFARRRLRIHGSSSEKKTGSSSSNEKLFFSR